MDVNSFIIYLHELRNQCTYTQAALQVFNQSIQQNSTTGVLFAGQAVLVAASQVAAILWPTRARARRRGEVLREKLRLPDEHAMADRRFVELWEHADEKLDEFVKSTKGRRVLFDYVGVPSQINLPDLTESGVYRMYDTENRIFTFRGIGYNFVNLSKAIEEIGRRAETLHQQIMNLVKQQAEAAQQGEQGVPADATAESVPETESAPASKQDLPSPVEET